MGKKQHYCNEDEYSENDILEIENFSKGMIHNDYKDVMLCMQLIKIIMKEYVCACVYKQIKDIMIKEYIYIYI